MSIMEESDTDSDLSESESEASDMEEMREKRGKLQCSAYLITLWTWAQFPSKFSNHLGGEGVILYLCMGSNDGWGGQPGEISIMFLLIYF